MKSEIKVDFEKLRRELPAATIRDKLLTVLKASPWITQNDMCRELGIVWHGGYHRVLTSLVEREEVVCKPEIQANGQLVKVYALKAE